MFRVAVVLALASVLLTALALISCLSIDDKRTIRGMPRALWVIAILLIPLGGAIAWFLAGRPQPVGASRTGWRIAGGLPEPPRPRAPDDDPEFLRSLDLDQPTISSQEEELLREWEEDLKRREDDQRRSDPGADA